ncbi:hypothetical protein [Dokdonella sp.]|uniref:hypothetical protein n=1 Tax=Dokdonella sp. TaxID=2291710 RepID=UPI003C331EB2
MLVLIVSILVLAGAALTVLRVQNGSLFGGANSTDRTLPTDYPVVSRLDSESSTPESDTAPTSQSALDRAPPNQMAAPTAPGVESYFLEDPGQSLRITNLSDQYSALAALAAQGDVVAARTLFRGLNICEQSPLDAKELSNFETKGNDPNSLFYSGTASGKQSLERARTLYPHCKGLTASQITAKRMWVAQLAEAGDSEARLKFQYYRPEDFDQIDYAERFNAFQEQARSYLNAEVSAGNPDGLLAMANGHMPAVSENQHMAFQADPFTAYTYYYAYGMTPHPDFDVTNLLARLQDQLSPVQIQDATNRAIELVDEHF